MTVSYSGHIATTRYWTFLQLLLRWRGSIYKLIWFEFVLFCAGYSILSGIYRTLMNATQRRIFEKICLHCEKFISFIPVVFVLGFFVTMIVNRWWAQFMAIPWPDRASIMLSSFIHGDSEEVISLRRQIIRYVNLSYILTMRSISSPVKKRFPTELHLVNAGLMTVNEMHAFDSVDVPYNKYYVPMGWAVHLATQARREGVIRQDPQINMLVNELTAFRERLNLIFWYDWINPPLVYVQVATISVHTFFIATLFGRQFLSPKAGYINHDMDLYFPFFTIFQFVFYMGWLKVGESLINPFGEDDDDFDINFLIDRNVQISYLIVDELHRNRPEMVQDAFWDKKEEEIHLLSPTVPDLPPEPEPEPGLLSNIFGARRRSVSRIFDGSVTNLHLPQSKMSVVSSEKRHRSRDKRHDSVTSLGSSSVASLASSSNINSNLVPLMGLNAGEMSRRASLYSIQEKSDSEPNIDVIKVEEVPLVRRKNAVSSPNVDTEYNISQQLNPISVVTESLASDVTRDTLFE